MEDVIHKTISLGQWSEGQMIRNACNWLLIAISTLRVERGTFFESLERGNERAG
jgi:hypothetical protein